MIYKYKDGKIQDQKRIQEDDLTSENIKTDYVYHMNKKDWGKRHDKDFYGIIHIKNIERLELECKYLAKLAIGMIIYDIVIKDDTDMINFVRDYR